MRLPAMYFFLCGHCFSLSHSGISERSSRVRTWVRSVLAIVLYKICGAYDTNPDEVDKLLLRQNQMQPGPKSRWSGQPVGKQDYSTFTRSGRASESPPWPLS